jgi:hypothetical protein
MSLNYQETMNWTTSGKRHYGKDIEGGKVNQETILKAIASISWAKHKAASRYPVMVSQAVEAISGMMNWSPESLLEIGQGNALAPYGFIGITTRYKDSDVRSYWLDLGIEVVCLCSEKIERVQGN